MKKSYPVTILGQKFVLKSESDELHVQRIADYVNGVMDEVRAKAPGVSMQNLAILGALNIAEEFFKTRRSWSSQIENWADRLESALEAAPDPVP